MTIVGADFDGRVEPEQAQRPEPDTNKTSLKTSFVVTGFGPFGSVDENPTTAIVRELDEYLRTSSFEGVDASILADAVKECCVVQTSAEAVNKTLDRIQAEHIDPLTIAHFESESETPTQSTQNRLILLHLGVARSPGFRLESCAYNEATFRIPDQTGYQPRGAPILKDVTRPIGACLRTTLDLDRLHERLKREFPLIETVVSTDPGRYVCNYVYCKSLEKTLSESRNENGDDSGSGTEGLCASLFLHVPHFECVPKAEQLAYVAAILRELNGL